MTQGLSREQLGITDALVRTYGETVFRLSNNIQHRTGDPIRLLDLQDIEAQRPALGMSDAQIAARIGLTERQVTYIRNLEEIERMSTNNFQRLLTLGGGKRFRVERFVPHEERFMYSDTALRLRAALDFDPVAAKAFLDNGEWGTDTFRGWLDRSADSTPERCAISGEGISLSYAELQHEVRNVASGLMALGIEPGEVVSVQLPNGLEYVLSYLGITYYGAVMSTLYLPHREAEMANIMAHARTRALICLDAQGDFSPGETALALKRNGTLPNLTEIIVVGEPIDGTRNFATLLDTKPTELPSPVAADPMLLLYTSGTTAGPKGVPHNAHTLLSNTRLGIPEHAVTPEDRFLSVAPFGHLFGQYSLHLAWCAGAETHLMATFTPPAFAETIETERPTVVFAAPAQLSACVASGAFAGRDFSSVRMVITAGSAVPAELVAAVNEVLPNGAVCQLWGMTETQAGSYTRHDDPPEIAGSSAGRPSPGTQARTVAEDGSPLPSGQEGELQVRGSLLFPGYLDNDDANAVAFAEGGWFRTGDLAVIDTGGNITITGRIKDLINRGGIKYNPLDVETLIDQHPAVAQCAIVPLPDEVLGERACCFAVFHSGASVTLEALCEYLLDHGIAKIKLPERLEALDALPLTPTRKVIKGQLAARFQR